MQRNEKLVADPNYRFMYYFDRDSGLYARTDILDASGRETGVQPFRASWPHLLDIGIMGHCDHAHTGVCQAAGVQCYQSGGILAEPHMTLDDYKCVMRQAAGKVNQVALGGRGDPDCHPDFGSILRCTREHDIVPNYTTSGFRVTDDTVKLTREYCGAVAVSWYKAPHTNRTIRSFIDSGVKTNIHFVLSDQSIGEAVQTLQQGGFPSGINAIIFLLHKPKGLGQPGLSVRYDDPRLRQFISLVERGDQPFKIGFDTCTFPALLNLSSNIAFESVDTCEAARFSAYVTADMNLLPCSFEQDRSFGVSLRETSLLQAWSSPQFERFRRIFSSSCPQCSDRAGCLGGCPIVPDVVLCHRPERKKGETE